MVRKTNKFTKSPSSAAKPATSRAPAVPVPCLMPGPEAIVVHPSLLKYFGYTLHKLGLRMKFRMEEITRESGLVSPQLGILVILRDGPALNQVRLGDSLGIDKATMVKLLDGLERLKLVTREAGSPDRRVKVIHITDKGRKLSLAIQVRVREIEQEFLSVLPADRRKALMEDIPLVLQASLKMSASEEPTKD